MHHSDKSYGFDCNFKGYFYQIVPAYFMLDYIDLKKRHLESMRNLFKDKLEGFRGKVSMSDNYYIMKMKIRE